MGNNPKLVYDKLAASRSSLTLEHIFSMVSQITFIIY